MSEGSGPKGLPRAESRFALLKALGRGQAVRGLLKSLLRTIRTVAGMPDYHRYVEHLRTCHPDRPVPTEREYFTQYTETRYGAGMSRCC